MMNKFTDLPTKLFLALFLFGFLFQQQSYAQKKGRYSSVKEALSVGGRLRGTYGPRNVNWIDGGNRYSYMQYNQETQSMEIRAYDPATGEDELIFNNKNHTFPNSDSTFEYSSFQWSSDSEYLVFQSNFRPVYRNSGISDYYLYSLDDGTLTLLVKNARTAELSPDGQKIGYEREGDLFVYNLEKKKETRLTDSAKEYFYNGRFGWVYEEEFGLPQAWTWSPDSKYIAYWQTDERNVHLFKMTDYSGHHPSYKKIPYPEVGDKNPSVKIGVIDINNKEHQWMDIPDGGYIPRIYWTSVEGQLAIVHLNRAQNHLQLLFDNVKTGDGRIVMDEESDTWIDIFDFFAGVQDYFYFPKDSKEFFWISDRDGWNHLYRYGYDGKLKKQVTTGHWEVTKVNAVDYKNNLIYYTSTEESPLERHLYSINFNGRHKKKITKVKGRHNISMGENGKYFINRYSNISTPTQVELWSTQDGKLKTLENNDSVNEFIESHVYAPKELFSFTTSDSQKIDGQMIKPVDFDASKKYPLLLNIYGGPGSQGVYNSWESNGWVQYLAQEGYVIVNINNRGSGGYGSEFEKIVYKHLGKWESHDFAEAAKFMASKSWIDGNHIAIRGHSYGGFMTTFSLFTHPDVFDVGLAGAPVTDWRYYDSIYSERYMGLVQNNREGYDQSASLTHAQDLKGHLFVAHATMDDNVHIQNTMQLMTALAKNGIDADLRIYPPGSHGVAFNTASYYLLYETYVKYLDRYLK